MSEPGRGEWVCALAGALLVHAGIAALLWQPVPSGGGADSSGSIAFVLASSGGAAAHDTGAPTMPATDGEAGLEAEPADAPLPVETETAEAPLQDEAPATTSFVPPTPLAKPRRAPAPATPPAPASTAAASTGPAPAAPRDIAGETSGRGNDEALLAAEPAAGGAGQMPAGPAGASAAYHDYLAALQAWLERHKDYPRGARSRRQTGTGVLQFTVDRSGRVVAQRLEVSTGHDLLDRAVLAMVERAQPLPPMPDTLGHDRLEIVLPVEFRAPMSGTATICNNYSK